MNYFKTIKAIKPKKRLGQNFLINPHIAEFEAEFGKGKIVLEIGPGLGMLTHALLSHAVKVIAVEKDREMYALLKHEFSENEKNLLLINNDILNIETDHIQVADIIIANVPYNISSKVLDLIANLKIDAVLCLQKEFVEHMLAKPGTKKYSKLSVFSQLQFDVRVLKRINANNFYPVPKVDSSIIYIKFRAEIDKEILNIISLIMMHKKKTLRNSILDSSQKLGFDKESTESFATESIHSREKVFKLSPVQLLEIAKRVKKLQDSTKRI